MEASPPVCICWSLHLGMHLHGYLSIFWHKYRWWKWIIQVQAALHRFVGSKNPRLPERACMICVVSGKMSYVFWPFFCYSFISPFPSPWMWPVFSGNGRSPSMQLSEVARDGASYFDSSLVCVTEALLLFEPTELWSRPKVSLTEVNPIVWSYQ